MAAKVQNPLTGTVHSQKTVIANIAHIYEGTPYFPLERDLAIQVVKELEDRRALYNDYELEVPRWVVDSVIHMRVILHEQLLKTREENALAKRLRTMRAACRKFLDAVQTHPGGIVIDNSFHGGPDSWKFFTALGELRASIGLELSLLMGAYDLTCEPELARILPADPEED